MCPVTSQGHQLKKKSLRTKRLLPCTAILHHRDRKVIRACVVKSITICGIRVSRGSKRCENDRPYVIELAVAS